MVTKAGELAPLDALAAELRRVMVRGAFGALRAREVPSLLHLRCVVVVAEGFAREPLAVLPEVLTRIVAGVPGSSGKELAILLGTATKHRGLDYQARLQDACYLRYPAASPEEGKYRDVDTYRRKDTYARLTFLARAVERHEAFFRLRETPNRLDLRVPADTARSLAWLDRFHYYYGIWSAVSGVQNEAAIALDQRDDPNITDDQRHTRRRGVAFHAAVLCLRIDRFIAERGGAWLASTVEREQRLGELAWRLPAKLPFTALDESWLIERVLDMPLTGEGSPMPLFHKFWARVDASPEAADIDDRVTGWIADCCGPEDGCALHTWIDDATEYMDLIDREWEQVTSWFVQRPVPNAPSHQEVVRMQREWRLPGRSEQYLPNSEDA